MMNKEAQQVIEAARKEALRQNHRFITLEHLLWAIMGSSTGKDILENCLVDLKRLKSEVSDYMKGLEKIPRSGMQPLETVAFRRVIENAIRHVHFSSKKQADVGDLLVYLYEEKDSYALFFLQRQGLEKLDILRYISHGISKAQIYAEESEDDSDSLLDIMNEMDEVWHDTSEKSKESLHQDAEKEKQSKRRLSQDEKILNRLAVNLSELARKGKFDPLIGRTRELRRTIEVLCRRRKNNVVYVGDPGVGKTALAEGLASLLISDKAPPKLQGYEVFSIDMGTIIAGTRYRGDFEERLLQLFSALERRGKSIVFIDEIHTVVGAGLGGSGSLDAANILKPVLLKGQIKFIGATTFEEYRRYFEKDRALSRRFEKIDVAEPTRQETLAILKNLKKAYEDFHKVSFTHDALEACVDLSVRYIPERFLPDKAIDLLDEAGAFVALAGKKSVVGKRDIEKLVARYTGKSEKSLSQTKNDRLKSLKEKLKEVVLGQDEAIEAIVTAIWRAEAGLMRENKPVGSFLFIGPTGVGKTELARQIAKHLDIPLIRFDMSEYSEKHTISRFLGAPPGYVGFDQGAQLTDAIRKNPRCVLLLDEMEKAHSDIFHAFLQVMDNAQLTDATGRKADFRNVILIMTSNVGSREMGHLRIGFAGKEGGFEYGDPRQELKNTFPPEFLNRLDKVVVFGRLKKETILAIARKLLAELEEKLKEKKIRLRADEKALQYLAEKGYDENFGARPMARLIQDEITNKITQEILFGNLRKGGEVQLSASEGQLTFLFLGRVSGAGRAK
ncbi:MAG: AAA family ATPase [Leptospiraceae bacterium]|nr:AAA family ATPase [Leptospiraceae bacterium]